MIGDPKFTPSPLVNWLNWAQLGWALLSSSFPTEWALWVPWANVLKNEHCINPLGANNSSSGTSGAVNPFLCRVRALHKYRTQSLWEFSPGNAHSAGQSSLLCLSPLFQVHKVSDLFISHREVSPDKTPCKPLLICCRGGELCSPGLQWHQSPKVLGAKKANKENLFRASEQARTARWQSSSVWWLFCQSGVASLWSFCRSYYETRIWEIELALLPSEPAQGGHAARIRHIPCGSRHSLNNGFSRPLTFL